MKFARPCPALITGQVCAVQPVQFRRGQDLRCEIQHEVSKTRMPQCGLFDETQLVRWQASCVWFSRARMPQSCALSECFFCRLCKREGIS